MLRKFRIKLNEKEYLVEMEELTPGVVNVPIQQIQPTQPTQPTQPIQPVQASQTEAPIAHQPKGEGQVILSPMPGNILKVAKKIGDKVTKNEPVLVLEAMKMENEIVSPTDGIITSILVANGQVVDVSDELFTVQE